MALKEQDVVLYSTDADGNSVIQMPITRIENVEGAVKTVDDEVPDENGNVVNDARILARGYRGKLWGKQDALQFLANDDVVDIHGNWYDTSWHHTNGTVKQEIKVNDGYEQEAWTKIVRISSNCISTITLGSSWKWQGGSVPTIPTDGFLVCCWCGDMGIATIVFA